MDELFCYFCKTAFPLDLLRTFCLECGEPLLFREKDQKRRVYWEQEDSLQKFREFLPLEGIMPELVMGTGNTPLIHCENLMGKFSLPSLYAKNEAQNPTGSFKDRGTLMAVQKAVQRGMERIGTVSTGNMAASTAAFGARAGLKTVILVKEDTGREKLLSTAVFQPQLIKIEGDYGRLFRKSYEIGLSKSIYFMNSVDPLRMEGYKITAFEIYGQLNRTVPDYVFVPVSAGGHIIGLMRAFLMLKKNGFCEKIPKFIGIQAEGCAPIAQAFDKKSRKVERIHRADTIAHAISNPDPPGGSIALDMISKNGGLVISVSDHEIIRAQHLLAVHEGLFVLPASATTLAGLLKIHKRRDIALDKICVIILTGTGLKGFENLNLDLTGIPHYGLDELESHIE